MAANAEHERFLTLFQRMVDHTDAWIARTPPDKLDWVPIQTSAMRFGDRVSKVTIKGLIAHIVVGETHWARFLCDCEDGAAMLPPTYSALAEEFETGEFQALAHRTQAHNMDVFRALSASQLAKHVTWVGRRWTVMGFLWGAYAHRAFHIGNIDIYLRQAGVMAPEFFEFDPAIMA
ncbi:MAG TPA: DinB family protein [Rhizomicrobium sp.]|nr:DinB family protein [Rhizomicrobium sp.]